jgi:AGZA family xanthine/uracil permease-like MFS transporter
MMGLGSIVLGLIANLPYIMAPATVIVIFLSEFTKTNVQGTLNEQLSLSSAATIISGCILIFMGIRPLGVFITKLIPIPISVGTAVGIGLLTSLKGATEAGIVIFESSTSSVSSTTTHIALGSLQDSDIYIVGFGYFLISILLHYRLKSAFCIALFLCTCLGWIVDPSGAPKRVGSVPQIHSNVDMLSTWNNPKLSLFTADLVFLNIIYLNGVLTPLIKMANLESVTSLAKNPRGKWVFVISGIMSIFSGFASGPPIVISPESIAGIKAGAKTGLSSIVGGIIFLLTIFLIPIFQAVPTAGTSPVLLMVGTILFQNVAGINWKNITESSTAFVVLFFIPFTSSVVQGVLIGYVNYVVVGTATLHNHEKFYSLLNYYLPEFAQKIKPKEKVDDDISIVVPEIQTVPDNEYNANNM